MTDSMKKIGYSFISFLLFCFMSCGNNDSLQNSVIIQEKGIENIRIICDSIHLLSGINSYPVFFRVDNPSNYNVLLTINKNGLGDTLRKSFLLIGPNNDTLPIYDDDGGYRLVKAHMSLYFTSEISRNYFMTKSVFKPGTGSYFELVNQFIKNSRMIYITDSIHNDIKEYPPGVNTMFLLKNIVCINSKNTVINSNFTSMKDWRRLYEKKMDSLE